MRHAAALILLLATGCGATVPQVKVADILAQCDAYKGKPVQAMGYLGQCTVIEGCALAAHKAGWIAFGRAWTTYQELSQRPELHDTAKASERVMKFMPLGFKPQDEAGYAFVHKAEPLQNSYVVMTGTISKDGCTGVADAEHSYGIQPTDIRAWAESEGAPATSSRR